MSGPLPLASWRVKLRRSTPWLTLAMLILVLSLPSYQYLPKPPASTALQPDTPLVDNRSGGVRVAYDLDITETAITQFAISFVLVTPDVRLYLNDREILTIDRAGGRRLLARSIPVLRDLPGPLLHTGHNRIVLETAGAIFPFVRDQVVFVAPVEQLRPYHGLAGLLLVVLPLCYIGASILMAGLLFGLWARQRHDEDYLAIGVFNALVLLKLPMFLSPDMEIPLLLLRLGSAAPLLQVSIIPAFVAGMLHLPWRRWMWLVPLAAILIPTINAICADWLYPDYVVTFATTFAQMCLLGSIFLILQHRWGKWTPKELIMIWMLVMTEMSVLFFQTQTFVAGACILIVGILLLKRYANALYALDNANQNLVVKLRESTDLLTKTLEQRHAQEKRDLLQTERERLMRELHDGVGNRIVSALALCSQGGDQSREIDASLRATLGELRLVVTALDELDGDLAGGIASFLPQLRSQVRPFGVTIECDVADLPPIHWLRPAHVQHILRILQEAVMNAAKHSGSLVVCIIGIAGLPCLIVRDYGRGGAADREGGFGLRSMRARAQELQAELVIVNTSCGTDVMLRLPE